MALGMSKDFVIVLFISIFFAMGLRDGNMVWKIMLPFIIIKIIWRFLTRGKNNNG